MCTSVYFLDENLHVTNVRGLADHLKARPEDLAWRDGHVEGAHGIDYKYCLCPIDLESTIAKFGLDGMWAEDGDTMTYLASRPDRADAP